ncbi:unnamed protein product [Caretta caretta]
MKWLLKRWSQGTKGAGHWKNRQDSSSGFLKGGQQTLREAAAMLVIREEQGKELIGTTFYRSRGWLAWKEKGDSGVLKCWPTRDCSLQLCYNFDGNESLSTIVSGKGNRLEEEEATMVYEYSE